ncbi:MAG: hypothetical protein R6V31_06280 [Halohasta sp.]
MSRHRELVLLIALTAALSLTLGTSGVSSVSADRGIDVAVADDQRAFLAFEQHATTTNETTSLEVTVGNQYPDGTPLSTGTVSVGGSTVDLAADQQLAGGEQRTFRFESVSCSDRVRIEAAGPGVTTTVERPVAC